MNGAQALEQMREAGFSDGERSDWAIGRRQHMAEAGFAQDEINTYFGQPPFNQQAVLAYTQGTLTKATQPKAEGGQPTPVTDFTEALKAGFGESVTGLLTQGKPTKALALDAPRLSRIASQVGTLAGDLPAIAGGFLAGGGPASPVTGMAGAFALPAGVRKILMDSYDKGEVTSFGDFWDRFSGAFIDTAKGYVTGLATGAAGKAIGLAPIVSPTVKAAATMAGEVATMVTVGKALEGQIPEPDNFIDTAIALGFIKGTMKATTKLRDIYRQTGVKPSEVAQDAVNDPTIHQDLTSETTDIPRAYQSKAEPSVEEIHALAEANGMHWDKAPAFMDLTEQLTGKRHLDQLTPAERETVYSALQEFPTVAKPPRDYETIQKDIDELETKLDKQGVNISNLYDPHDPGTKILEGYQDWKPMPEQLSSLYRERFAIEASDKNDFINKTVADSGLPIDEATAAIKELYLDKNGLTMHFSDTLSEWSRNHSSNLTKLYNFFASRKYSDLEMHYAKFAWGGTGDKPVMTARVERGGSLDQEILKKVESVYNAVASNIGARTISLARGGKNDMAEWEPNVAMGGGAPPKTPKPAATTQASAAQSPEQVVLDRLVLKDPEKAGWSLSDLYTSVVDNLNPIHRALKSTGKDNLSTATNPYELERLTRGIAGKASEFLNAGAFDFETYQTTTPGYFKILDPVKNDLDRFRAFLVSKRALEKEGQGIHTGIPLEEAREVVKQGGKKFEAVHQARLAYRHALLDTLQKSGILSAKAVEDMREANKDYVPFYRFFEDEEGRPHMAGQVRNPVKRMTGSERKILDPIISDIKDTFLFVGLAEKNAARQAYVKLGPDFAEKQRQPIQATHLTEPEIRSLFDEFMTVRKHTQTTSTSTTSTTGGAEAAPNSRQAQMIVGRVRDALLARGFHLGEADQMIRRVGEAESSKIGATVETVIREIESTTYVPEIDIRVPNEVATIFRAMQRPAKDDEIAVFTKGHRDLYTVDPKVAESFNGLDAGPTSLLAKIAYAPASLLRAGVTITPDFIMRNVMRDAISAFIYAGSNPIKTALGLKSIITQDTAFHAWLKGGGAQATMVAIDRDYLSQHLGQLNAETGLMQRAWNVAKTPLDLLRATSELVENATRLGSVRSELLRTQDKARIQALSLIARESTVDFGRHGKDTMGFARATAFFNPAVQGIDRFMREMHEKPLATTAKAMASVTLPSMLLWYANKDDKDIQDVARWQKYLFWMARVPLPNGGSFILRIPKPQEFGILFGTVPEILLDMFVADNQNAMRDIHKTLLDAFTPSLIPTAAVPIISQFANRDTFRNQPLIPSGQEKLLPEYQYTPYTTELAKAMGQIIGAFPGMEHAAVQQEDPFIGGTARALTTPILLETYLRDWTGGMGMYLMQLADKGLRSAHVLPDPVKPASTLADIPFVRAFVVRYPSATARSIQDFYSDFDASERYYTTIMALAKDGNPTAADLMRAHEADMIQLTDIRDVLTEHSQLVRMIDKDPAITSGEKRQLIDTLYYRMIELARFGNQALRDVETVAHRTK